MYFYSKNVELSLEYICEITVRCNEISAQNQWYGTKVIEFSKNKNAIEVNSGEELITTLQKLRTATMSGELDDCINTASLLVKARFKK